ncbi:hypothetical protein [Nocardia sp. alder85J]|uniref:hypothetical protein n=1 Tax=Nocardia sp. alder85J TaxID=2862949 RepID=UPI003A4DD0D4
MAIHDDLLTEARSLPSSATGNGPAECHDLMALNFTSHYYQAFAQIPSYSRWFAHEADLTATYRYERRVLKLLQWGFHRSRGDRFHDIDFRAMQQDPISEVTRRYDRLGEPITDEFAAGMRQWWHDNAEQREANVHPDPAAFGLDFDEVRPLFAEYVARAAIWTASR